jgi:hypothetical protein
MQYSNEEYIRQELTFSEVDKLRRMALDAAMGLLCLKRFGFKESYLEEVEKGIKFCQRFRQGCILARDTTPASTPDLSLLQAFQLISHKAHERKITLEGLNDKVSTLEGKLSFLLGKKGSVNKKEMNASHRALLDIVKSLR